MAWMPRLHVHLDYLDESHPRDPAREQGVFVHACLERLCGLPAPARDPELVVDQGLETTPWLAGTAPADGTATSFREQALAELKWFLSLPQAPAWLAAGLPEQSLLDARSGGWTAPQSLPARCSRRGAGDNAQLGSSRRRGRLP